MILQCPLCGVPSHEPVWGRERVPILPMLRVGESPQPDHFATLEVVRCSACGHLYNRAYDAALADRMYRSELLSSVPVHVSMSRYLEEIAQWIGRPQYASRRVIEVGAGSGHLARILAQAAHQLWVFEPCRGLRAEMLPEPNITLINEPFAASLVEQPADLIVCRQVLEHVASPLGLLRQIRAALRDGGALYLEVPRAEYIEDHAALFDLHYAHVQYFHEPNLLGLAAQAGFEPVRNWQIKDGHDVGVLLRPARHPVARDSGSGLQASDSLCSRLEERRARTCAWLASVEGPVALYGACAQGAAFLDVFQAEGRFAVAVDDNPSYEGYALYSASQCVPVVRSTHEAARRSAHVVIAAYLHDTVIASRLREAGCAGQVVSLRAPAPAFSEAGR